MIMNTLINSVLLMAILISIGVFLVRKNIINLEVEKSLTYILLNIALPMLVVSAFNLEYSPDKLELGFKVLGVGFLNAVMVMLANYLLVKNVKDRNKRKILYYTGVNTNCAFMGFPIIYQVFGSEGMFYASMFYIPMVIYMWTYGMAIFFDKISYREIKQMLFNINMIAVYVGLVVFVFSIKIPNIMENVMTSVGGITTPLAMFIIGARIGRIKISNIVNDYLIYIGSIIRLMILPFVMVVILFFIELDPMTRGICIIFSSLPPATMTVVMASRFDCAPEFSSKLIVLTHIFSLITIPVVFGIISYL